MKVKIKDFKKEKEFLERHNLKTVNVKCGEFYKIFHVYLTVMALEKKIEDLTYRLEGLEK